MGVDLARWTLRDRYCPRRGSSGDSVLPPVAHKVSQGIAMLGGTGCEAPSNNEVNLTKRAVLICEKGFIERASQVTSVLCLLRGSILDSTTANLLSSARAGGSRGV